MSDLPKITRNEYEIDQTKRVIEHWKKQRPYTVDKAREHMKIQKVGYMEKENKVL